MTYLSNHSAAPPMVSTMTLGWSMFPQERVATSEPSSAAFESANRAAYHPILVPTTCVAKRLFWVNGSTVSASYNVDAGIYLDGGYKPGKLLVSTGSTAQGTASEVQFVDITDTTLRPGLYWIALACSSTSATFLRNTPTGGFSVWRFAQNSALPLPSTATPIDTSSNTTYFVGFSTTVSP